MMDSTKTTLDLSTPESRKQFWKIGLLLSGVMALIPLYYLVSNMMKGGGAWEGELLLHNLFRGIANVVMAFLSNLAIVGAIALCLRNTLPGNGDQAWPRLWSWLLLFGVLLLVLRLVLDYCAWFAFDSDKGVVDFFERFNFYIGYYQVFHVMLLGMALGMLLLRGSWGPWALFLLAYLLFPVIYALVFKLGAESPEGVNVWSFWIFPYLLTLVEFIGFSLGVYYGMRKQQNAFVEASEVSISPVVVYAPRVLLGLYFLATYGFHWEFLLAMKSGGDSVFFIVRFLVLQILLTAALSLWRLPKVPTYARWRSVFVVLTILTLLTIVFFAFGTEFGISQIVTRAVSMVGYLSIAVVLSKDRDRLERADLDALQKGI